jgi:hypothetical protein
MEKNNSKASASENSETPQQIIVKAHTEADKDMEKDPDLNAQPGPGDDLDEGELARFEGEE